jgi:hypothetical protein
MTFDLNCEILLSSFSASVAKVFKTETSAGKHVLIQDTICHLWRGGCCHIEPVQKRESKWHHLIDACQVLRLIMSAIPVALKKPDRTLLVPAL